MKFTNSKDGKLRSTFRAEIRLTEEETKNLIDIALENEMGLHELLNRSLADSIYSELLDRRKQRDG